MLYAYGFDTIGVVAGDLYFVDPTPGPGQEGAERGVRVELRRLDRGEIPGTIYAAYPITIGMPIWRVDLLESVAGPVGSFDRTHHHPTFTAWDPSHRNFVPELSADPLPWLEDRLRHVDEVLTTAGVAPDEIPEADRAGVAAMAPEIVEAVGRLLERVRTGELAQAPDLVPSGAGPVLVRTGWL